MQLQSITPYLPWIALVIAAIARAAGAAEGAWTMSIGTASELTHCAVRSAIAAGAIVACDALTKRMNMADGQPVGTYLAIAAVLAGIIAGALRGMSKSGG